jgi:hypothetical protein
MTGAPLGIKTDSESKCFVQLFSWGYVPLSLQRLNPVVHGVVLFFY